MLHIEENNVCIKILYLNQCVKKFGLQDNKVIDNKIHNSMKDEEYSFIVRDRIVWQMTTTNNGKHYDAIHI